MNMEYIEYNGITEYNESLQSKQCIRNAKIKAEQFQEQEIRMESQSEKQLKITLLYDHRNWLQDLKACGEDSEQFSYENMGTKKLVPFS